MKKKEGLDRAFQNFDCDKLAKFTPSDVDKLVQNPEIIRNRGKIEAVINNAR